MYYLWIFKKSVLMQMIEIRISFLKKKKKQKAQDAFKDAE